jgi:predicted enzyme related to lactoylglutathione lyase
MHLFSFDRRMSGQLNAEGTALAMAVLLGALALAGCADSPKSASVSTAGAAADGAGPEPSGNGPAQDAPPSGGGTARGGGSATGGASTGGGTETGGGAGAATASDGGSSGTSAGGEAFGGDASSAGATSSGGGAPSPPPVAEPLVWGFGIGVSDLPAAVDFYDRVMKMKVEKDAVRREDRTETTLYGAQAMRGARLTLMKFDDQRNTRKITAKLVWQSRNVSSVTDAASKFPDYVSRLGGLIVQFDGPDTYIHEVGGIFDSGGRAIDVPYPIALGFAVSDQPAATKFYTALGMSSTRLGSFTVTDATGRGTITEYSTKFETGTGVVLQKWSPARNATDNPIKVVLMVPDAMAMADKVVAAGGKIVSPASRSEAYDGRLLVVAKDLDGYILELVQ